MGLDKPNEQVEPPKSDVMKEREELKKLLGEKPLTRGALDLLDEARSNARYWENRIAEAPQIKHNIPLQEQFLQTHEGFVDDLSKIHYDLGRLENVGEMMEAAKAVEWQTKDGTHDHKMFDEATKIVEASRNSLNAAKEATVRRLDGLMKMGYVHDKIHEDAMVEDEILGMTRPSSI